MALIRFFEKPGCINNTKQKQWLEAAGHELEVHSILSHPWRRDELRKYLAGSPVIDWFNLSAPVIKRGELTPESFDEESALDAMLETPLLIKRPLLQIADHYLLGFDKEGLDALIGLAAKPGKEATVELLDKQDLTVCPRPIKTTVCP